MKLSNFFNTVTDILMKSSAERKAEKSQRLLDIERQEIVEDYLNEFATAEQIDEIVQEVKESSALFSASSKKPDNEDGAVFGSKLPDADNFSYVPKRLYANERIIRELIVPLIAHRERLIEHFQKRVRETGQVSANDLRKSGDDVDGAVFTNSHDTESEIIRALNSAAQKVEKHKESLKSQSINLKDYHNDTDLCVELYDILAHDAHKFLSNDVHATLREIQSWPEDDLERLLEGLGQKEKFKATQDAIDQLKTYSVQLPLHLKFHANQLEVSTGYYQLSDDGTFKVSDMSSSMLKRSVKNILDGTSEQIKGKQPEQYILKNVQRYYNTSRRIQLDPRKVQHQTSAHLPNINAE